MPKVHRSCWIIWCDDCAAHFEGVRACLTAAEIPFEIDTRIVRGLDYYTRTVFEFISDALGAQATVCGGGRYDGLTKELGGPELPSWLCHGPRAASDDPGSQGDLHTRPGPAPELYLAPMGPDAVREGFAMGLPPAGGWGVGGIRHRGPGVKAQMKYADKLGAPDTSLWWGQ